VEQGQLVYLLEVGNSVDLGQDEFSINRQQKRDTHPLIQVLVL
jgi:hypothetical protein